jgi:hypothetical protein
MLSALAKLPAPSTLQAIIAPEGPAGEICAFLVLPICPV